MRYLKFRIRNFKGIKDTAIDLRSLTGANVFALVGLNESGKTTILEAIHSFSPDFRTRSLRGARLKNEAEAAKERLPRHLLARFTGAIVVEATLSANEAYKRAIANHLKSKSSITINWHDIPDVFTLIRSDLFERGDYVKTEKTFDFDINGKRERGKLKKIAGPDLEHVYQALWTYAPDIAYHDSFIFDFPKRIYLTPRPGTDDWVYRTMFEDVLAAGKVAYNLNDITRRIRNEKYKKDWLSFLTDWTQQDDKATVQQIIDQASQTITMAVLGKWDKIFGESVGNKEVSVQFGVEGGRIYNKESKTYSDSDEHDLYVSLELKDGTKRFPIQDRSLGFRWFFAFLLFTEFRTRRNTARPVLFLFDEPAANLHSAAQGRLIESFPGIATGDNMLMYSTHSHYMISPDWLEQTFIVTNAADVPGKGMLDSAVIEDESLNVSAQLYRSFANENPNETSYFQPIIDCIEVVPSRFDVSIPSAVVEGKSDFYILRYAQLMLDDDSVRLLPATGSGTFDALIALGAIWGTKFVFMLDSDNAGLKERRRYALERGAREEALCCLNDFDQSMKKIEDLLDTDALSIVAAKLGMANPSKKAIGRFFQEQLAKREMIQLGSGFEKRSRSVLEGLTGKLQGLG